MEVENINNLLALTGFTTHKDYSGKNDGVTKLKYDM